MDKNRIIADLNLINELLSCPSGEELALLQANQELVDTDFVLVMQQAATKLAGDGNQESADFLQNLANQVSRMLLQGPEAANFEESRTQSYMNLIDKLIACPNGQEPDVLDAHADLLDPSFVQTLVQVATSMAHEGNQDTAKFLIHVARELSKMLGLYPQVSSEAPVESEASPA